jgi:uncharacterized protein YjbI with pentapeptide repeats
MANTNVPILNKLANKTVYLAGRFDRGVKERLIELVEAQQGTLVVVLNARTHYLVIADLAAGKTVQKEAATFNAKKGAAIQTIDADAFLQLLQPAPAEMIQLIHNGAASAETFNKAIGGRGGYFMHKVNRGNLPLIIVTGENFDGLDLRGFLFHQIAFHHCSFVGATLDHAILASPRSCDFSKASGEKAQFREPVDCKFIAGSFPSARFSGDLTDSDFCSASLVGTQWVAAWPQHSGTATGCKFTGAALDKSVMQNLSLALPDFQRADLQGASLSACRLDSPNFRSANLSNAYLIDCQLPSADFTDANCADANFAGNDLSGARFDNADLAGANTRGINLTPADLVNARNYSPAPPAPSLGPSLGELDTLSKTAVRIKVSFRVRRDDTDEGQEVGVDSPYLKHGWGIRMPVGMLPPRRVRQRTTMTFSDALLHLATILATQKVRYETVEVASTKSPKTGKELRQIAMAAIAEAFAQPIPPAEELAAATKAYRAQLAEKTAVDRERRENAKKLAAQQQATAKRQIAVKIAKTVGSVTDIASFLKALELRADKSKIDKATKMLKAEKFQLFNDITDAHLNGVVKSQTDPDLVYACRIESGGKYACCTQNLNICGGLRGSICKHLLVLIIGLVKAGQLDPSTIDGWIAKTHDAKPELDKEIMGEIFIRYKGAEAGEVDWRPTETVPEDYYAV